jgi:2-aminoethylphosphonate-pyruvate transaminase
MTDTAAFPDPKMGEPFLLTPGPLTTAFSVKEAMLRDWGSWDGDFRAMTKSLCDQLVALAGDTKGEFACVPMQGSGSFCVEAMLGTMVPRDGKVLVLANGAYGLRAAEDAAGHGAGLHPDRQRRLSAPPWG